MEQVQQATDTDDVQAYRGEGPRWLGREGRKRDVQLLGGIHGMQQGVNKDKRGGATKISDGVTRV